ncbi:MAG: hypothetical protein KBB04_13700, partial [Methanothrix sp.]|uniref:hypothetical protein n=1 Tax=Methanothrix sp. TaxID=90426 RepID=UPI001B5B1D07
AVELLGFGSRALRRVPVNESMQIDLESLKEAIKTDREGGYHPLPLPVIPPCPPSYPWPNADPPPGIGRHESNQDEMYHPDGSGLVLFDPSNILKCFQSH